MTSWRLVDADPIALANRYTFYKPSRALIAKVCPGELVKLIFEFDSTDPTAPRAERMWVRVTAVRPPDEFIGTLDNDPRHIKDLACGDQTAFHACHVINTERHDDDDNLIDRYIRRCFVTKRVLGGEDPPAYVYREEPGRPDDSGWRILAGNETDEFMNDPANCTYVSLGAVLNSNDSFVHLLEAPVGSAYVVDRATGLFLTRFERGANFSGARTPRRQGGIVTVKRMDNVGIVVEDIDAAVEFFIELGLTLEGRMPIEGEWAGRVTGVRGQRVEIAMMRTPDGHSRLELSRFNAPAIASDHRSAPVNSLGYLRVMFTVEDIDDTLARLSKLGAKVVDEVVDYADLYRLCYIRGPEGILIGLAQQLGQQTSRENPMERER